MKKFGCLGIALAGAGALAFLAVIFLVYAVSVNNRMVAREQAVDSKWAQVQNVYQRRADLVPNLVETVKGAANFERTTLNEVISARASVGQVQVNPNQAPTSPQALQQFQAAQDQLSGALSRLLVVVERYPELKANANFRDLQAQLEGTENRISVARMDFNNAVQDYNTYIKKVPANIIASFLGFEPRPYFEATAGADRPPDVNFNFNTNTNAQ